MSTATKLIEKGETKKQIEVARKMLKKGMDIATISELTDLSTVEIKNLK